MSTKNKKTKIAPSYLLSDNFVMVVFKGEPYTVHKDDFRFTELIKIIKNQNWSKLEEALITRKALEKMTKGEITIKNGVLYYGDKVLEHTLTTKILKFKADGLPITPLIKFLEKLLSNPNQNSIEQLYNYLERYKLPITETGNFLAMKAVTSNFKDKYTGKIDNSIGATPSLPRASCNEDENVACGPSLHAGNIDYVKNYGGGESEAILVEINPKDVVSCPKCSTYQKLRVCAYKVIGKLGKCVNLTPFKSEYLPQKEVVKPSRDSKGRFLSKDKKNTLTKSLKSKRDSKGRFLSKKELTRLEDNYNETLN